MANRELLASLANDKDVKIVLLVMDGVGGLAQEGEGPTELEAARTPNLDCLAREGVTGLSDPVAPGITPGSGPSHLALFGYDPLEYQIGRGVLEALGVGLEMTGNDLAARANFATMDSSGNIIDRRAGRIPTEKNEELCSLLASSIAEVEDVEIIIRSGLEHRWVVLLRGGGLSGDLNDTDPQHTGVPAHVVSPGSPAAEKAARVINAFISRANEVLKVHEPANTFLLRGIAKYPDIPALGTLKLDPVGIAGAPMYRGLARLVGMRTPEAGITPADVVTALKQEYDRGDFFYVHVKKTDSYGEDGNFDAKVHVIEETDELIPDIVSLEPDVLVVTCDHSTPAKLASHSWHPCPFLLHADTVRRDGAKVFS